MSSTFLNSPLPTDHPNKLEYQCQLFFGRTHPSFYSGWWTVSHQRPVSSTHGRGMNCWRYDRISWNCNENLSTNPLKTTQNPIVVASFHSEYDTRYTPHTIHPSSPPEVPVYTSKHPGIFIFNKRTHSTISNRFSHTTTPHHAIRRLVENTLQLTL